MRPVLLIDFGSTYTKLTAVDTQAPRILGGAQAFTTASTDIMRGFEEALARLTASAGPLRFDARLACSSAAGGLRMVVCGLVPALTAKAARLAAFGAGAKVVRTYAYGLTREDVREIGETAPDILLLTGGTDGGNTEVILRNAGMIAGIPGEWPVVVAGNRGAQDECAEILRAGTHPVYTAANVMPEMNRLNPGPVQQVIRDVFLTRIVRAKGLSRASAMLDDILMPTPSAALAALTLLSEGTKATRGLGELAAVDLGGATTDVYSIARGDPVKPGVFLRELPEPYAKRTVEGDIGMRYSAAGVLEAAGAEQLAAHAGVTTESLLDYAARLRSAPDTLPESPEEEALDRALAIGAVGAAFARHCGTLERVYTPAGPVDQQNGKDLTSVRRVVLTGGALIYARDAQGILDRSLAMQPPSSLCPRGAGALTDRRYALSAMGLLGGADPEAALRLMLDDFGKEENDAAG